MVRTCGSLTALCSASTAGYGPFNNASSLVTRVFVAERALCCRLWNALFWLKTSSNLAAVLSLQQFGAARAKADFYGMCAGTLSNCINHALISEGEEIMGLLLGDVVDDGTGGRETNITRALPQIRNDRRKVHLTGSSAS